MKLTTHFCMLFAVVAKIDVTTPPMVGFIFKRQKQVDSQYYLCKTFKIM